MKTPCACPSCQLHQGPSRLSKWCTGCSFWELTSWGKRIGNAKVSLQKRNPQGTSGGLRRMHSHSLIQIIKVRINTIEETELIRIPIGFAPPPMNVNVEIKLLRKICQVWCIFLTPATSAWTACDGECNKLCCFVTLGFFRRWTNYGPRIGMVGNLALHVAGRASSQSSDYCCRRRQCCLRTPSWLHASNGYVRQEGWCFRRYL